MHDRIIFNQKKQILIIYIALIAVILAVYHQVHQFDFVNFDDQIYVMENTSVRSGISMKGFWGSLKITDSDFWHPVTWLSLMLDHQLYGLNAGGYHFTNLLLHMMNTLLLFWLFHRMTGAIWKSAFIASLFALHPLHVESVAWITKRKDVLSGFFWMLTLCLYVYYTEKPVMKRYVMALFSFALALMSKAMVITLPIIMILLDYWPLARFSSKQARLLSWQLMEKAPFLILSAVFSLMTVHIRFNWDNPFISEFPLKSRLINVPVTFMTYLDKTFWPSDMAVFYPFSNQVPFWQVLGSAILIIIISITSITVIKRLPHLFVGWLWYSITILPVIGIIQVGIRATSDNYTYLPLIGIFVIISWGISDLFQTEKARRKILFPLAIIFLMILSLFAWRQCGYWRNSISLFSHALHVTKDNYLAHDNLAAALIKKGKLKEAFYHCNRSIAGWPYFEKSYFNRGLIYAKDGQYLLAIEDLSRAISLKPDFDAAFYQRGIAYGELGQHQLAIKDFRKAILIQPSYIHSLNNRGSAYANQKKYEQAIEYYNEAIHLQPYNALAYNNRGAAYLTKGKISSGCQDAYKACELGNCKTLKIARSKKDCL